jgi:heat shock protein HtpX
MKTLVNDVKTVALLAGLTGFVLIAGYLLGGTGGAMIALLISLVMNMGALFFGDRIALMSMQAKEVGPEHRLYQITARLAQRANMPMPKVYVSPQMAPNAFATGRGPQSGKVCATEGLMQILNENEIAGVMAHELAHIKHRDILISTVAAAIGGAITFIGYMFMFGGSSDEGEEQSPLAPIAGILVLILGPIAAALIQMAISRQREYAADTEGARIAGDPMHLATALEKVHAYAHQIPMNAPPAMNAMMIAEPRNLRGQMASLFQTHPALQRRIQNLIGRPATGLVRLG